MRLPAEFCFLLKCLFFIYYNIFYLRNFLFYLLMWYVKIRLDKLTILLTILNVGHSNKKFYILWIKTKIIKGVISILVKEYISNYYFFFFLEGQITTTKDFGGCNLSQS